MELCEVINKYNEEKLYNIVDVKGNFKEYFGMTIEEMIQFFNNYHFVSKQEVITYLKDIYNNCFNLEEIIKNRMLEYEYYENVLKILSNKGLSYLMIINYLCKCKEKDKDQERILEDIQIYHYSSIVTGKDINRLLIVLFHILYKFNNTLDGLNQKDNFKKQRLSPDALTFEKDELYPSKELIMKDDYYLDKTSLKTKIRKR